MLGQTYRKVSFEVSFFNCTWIIKNVVEASFFILKNSDLDFANLFTSKQHKSVRKYFLLIDRLIFRWNLIYAPSFRNCRSPKVSTMLQHSRVAKLEITKLKTVCSNLQHTVIQSLSTPPVIYTLVRNLSGVEWKIIIVKIVVTNFINPWIIVMVYFQGESKQFHDGMEIHRRALIIIQKQLNKK